jgi:hypothetical protein
MSDQLYQLPRTPEEKHAVSLAIGERRAKVAALILQRVPIREIAFRLNCHKRTIEKDKAKLLAAWSAEAGARIDLQVGRELAALDQDEFALRVAMRDDKDPRERLKYFDRIAELGKERRKLLGLDAMSKVGIRFEGNLTATTEIRDREFYQAMLADPDARAAMLERWRSATGMPSGLAAAPPPPGTNGQTT